MSDRTLPSQTTQVTKIGDLSVRIASNTTELTQDAAMLAQDYLQSRLQQQETVSIILATGNSQLEFLAAIAQGNQLDWSRIILFHLDEYLGISANHPGSFRYYLHHRVEQQVQPRQFHYIIGDAKEPLVECDRYNKLLQQQAIDLCLLGIGDNGHLAFNEPSVADFSDPQVIKLVQLETKTRQQQVNGGYFPSLDNVPSYAYTLTIPTISMAKKIFCLAGGSHKQGVVRQTLKNVIAPNFPATVLRTLPHATLFCDRDAFGS
ncbi:MAG: glucosamine-6-phosphate deaminase [Cyanobacteria bacterium J06623_7]